MPQLRKLIPGALALWGAVCLCPPVQAATRVGLLPLERFGEDDPAYASLELSLHRQVATLGGAPATDVLLPAGCVRTDVHCVSAAGKSAGAETVFATSVERTRDGYTLRIRNISTLGAPSRENTSLIRGSSAELEGAAELAACELLNADPCEGLLRVTGPASARLLIDGADAGAIPYLGRVAIGRHSLRVTLNAARSDEAWTAISWKQESVFNVAASGEHLVLERAASASPATTSSPSAEDLPLLVGLPPPDDAPPTPVVKAPAPTPVAEVPKSAPTNPVPSTQRLAFFSAVGAAGVLVIGGVVSGSVSQSLANSLNKKHTDGTLGPSDKGAYNTAKGTATAANVLYGLAGLGAVTAGVLFLLDPHVAGGGGDVNEGPTVSVSPSAMTVAGHF